MYRKLEAAGSRFLALFVPTVEAEAACGPQKVVNYSSCWQCEAPCGYYARCRAICRDGCGCQVTTCYC
ncbi:hypothetical protein [Micromonospora sp. NPDC005413]|uniref:hypothetical protein n=1 Tax=Micromonospora sp. NPDC005413 TaxID=3154563 RepID=UPI0033AF0FC9